MVIWLVGLSGSGKTTIGREIYKLWKPLAPNTVMVDGDDIRKIFGHDKGPNKYSVEGRRKNAERIVEICHWLDRQEINVVCCILCIFDDIMTNNKKIYSKYYQVYLDAPINLLKHRDPKGLYKRAEEGKEKNVVGLDLPFTKPTLSDIGIVINEDSPEPIVLAEMIMKKAGIISG